MEVFMGRKAYNDKALELHALSACILTIAGMDVGCQYRYIALQLFEMHSNTNISFDKVYDFFEKQS